MQHSDLIIANIKLRIVHKIPLTLVSFSITISPICIKIFFFYKKVEHGKMYYLLDI